MDTSNCFSPSHELETFAFNHIPVLSSFKCVQPVTKIKNGKSCWKETNWIIIKGRNKGRGVNTAFKVGDDRFKLVNRIDWKGVTFKILFFLLRKKNETHKSCIMIINRRIYPDEMWSGVESNKGTNVLEDFEIYRWLLISSRAIPIKCFVSHRPTDPFFSKSKKKKIPY